MKYILFLALLLNIGILHAQDRLFTYTYQSTVLNKGQKELEVWNTIRTGRDAYYLRLDNRSEFEVGLGSRLQTAFYLNITQKSQEVDFESTKILETETEIGFSNEWKLKLLDPVANPIGLALYVEYGVGTKSYEFEGKVILDKQIKKVTLAANGIYEYELEPEMEGGEMKWEKEQSADLNLAVAYSFSPHFALSNENTFRNVFSDGSLSHSALYTGIGMSYNIQNFWVNFTVLPQVVSFKDQGTGSLDLDEFEKVQFRLLFSYGF